ncbi:MAG: 5'/3'-nucleotidase SurE [Synergistaceae bacterium]|jgi:5'-nucleotidase|nr:5'/3'-nucleotidase SurE [Synergistaceae bacterium]
MKILLTNDDGVISPGIQIISRMLADHGWLSAVVAPDRERSGMGHAITVDRPVRVHPLDPGMFASDVSAYSCDGTPTDCVTIGLEALSPQADFVVSGINQGPNMGDDVTYSGTVCAAMEGVILGRPSVAISLCLNRGDNFKHNTTAALVATAILSYVEKTGLPNNVLLNVNVPNELIRKIKGFRITKRGTRLYRDKFTYLKDPHGSDCYWLAGKIEDVFDEGTDVTAVREGYVSVTPVNMDMTDYAVLDEMLSEGVGNILAKSLNITAN